VTDPHFGQPVVRRGPAPAEARLAVILVHGRGASPDDILPLADAFGLADVTYAAPQAAGRAWYPYSFLSPIQQNEPGLSSAIGVIARLVEEFGSDGLPADRVAIIGFSQGGCLALEYAARHARRYATVAGCSGGLIGPPGSQRTYSGSADATPVFLGCSDHDPHIPLARVHESAEVFRSLGADVDERIYSGTEHTINQDEIDAVRALLLRPAARRTS
jgi:predicted esterase